jgi:uncharacterized membrane protein
MTNPNALIITSILMSVVILFPPWWITSFYPIILCAQFYAVLHRIQLDKAEVIQEEEKIITSEIADLVMFTAADNQENI